jgi:hypothetical protein
VTRIADYRWRGTRLASSALRAPSNQVRRGRATGGGAPPLAVQHKDLGVLFKVVVIPWTRTSPRTR